MKLETPLRTLGPVNHQALKSAVEALSADAWLEDQMRQNTFRQHVHTQSVVLLFSSNWPNPDVQQRSGWDRLSGPATALMERIIADHYPPGGTVIRAMAAKLLAGGTISVHKDQHPSFEASHRIHVPLATNSGVDFTIRGLSHNLKEGVAYEVSNLDFHAVRNRGAEDRVHFIFDYTVR